MTHRDPMAAGLERIEAELAAQDRALAELRVVAASYGEVEIALPRSKLAQIERACTKRPAVRADKVITGIRC